MKKEWTEQDLRAFAENAQTAFEDVTLTEADEEAADTWQDDGLQVDYVLRNGQVDCVLRRLIEADGMRARQGDAVMNQLVCFVANQWKKYYDRPAERVVCRLTDTLFAIGCADKNCAELAEELNGIYAEMPRACVASVGLMRRVPFTQSIGCACTGEVRGKNWDALYQLCEQRLKAAQTAGGDQICSK